MIGGIIGEMRKLSVSKSGTWIMCVPRPWVRAHEEQLKKANRSVWVVFSKKAIVILPPDTPPEVLEKAKELLEGLS